MIIKIPVKDFIKSRLKTQLGKDVFWTLLGQLFIMLSHLVITKILSNDLTPEAFGQYNIIKRSSSVLSFVLLGGLGIALPRFLSVSVSKMNFRRVQSILRASVLYMSIIVVISFFVYYYFHQSISDTVAGSSDICLYLLVFVFSIENSIASFFYAYYRGLGKFDNFNISQIAMQVAIMIPLVGRTNSIAQIMGLWTITQAVVVFTIYIKERFKYRNISKVQVSTRVLLSDIEEVSKYSLPRLLGDFFLFAYSAFPILYIGRKMTLTDVSFFSVGMTLFTLATPIFSFLGVILLPMVARMVADKKYREADKLVNKLSYCYIVIAILITIVFFFGMKWLIPLFFSRDYLSSLHLSRILVLAIIPASMYYLYRNPIDAVSFKPYNTWILGFCFCMLVISFKFSFTLEHYALSYLCVSWFQGIASYVSWKRIINKNQKHGI